MRNNRSEHAANVALHPDTLQAMRNLSALQAMHSNGWHVGRTFTRPAPARPAAHTMASRPSTRDSVHACSRELIGCAVAIVGAVASYLLLVSF